VTETSDSNVDRAPARRRRIVVASSALLLLASALAVYLVAIHGDNGSSTEGADPGEVAQLYAHALAANDAAEVCTLMSPAARQAFTTNMSAFVRGACSSLVKIALEQAPAHGFSGLGDARVSQVRISGQTAQATLVAGTREAVFTLVNVDGQWLLAPAAEGLIG
jgi:hypothetical protein